MNPGELNSRMVIQKQTGASIVDDNGTTRAVWEDVLSCWASVAPLRNKYIYQYNLIQSLITTKVRLRFTSAVKELMRIKFGNIFYDIFQIVDIDNKHIETNLFCANIFPLDKICTVIKTPISRKDPTFNRPIKVGPVTIKYPCAWVKKNSVYLQEIPNPVETCNYVIYGESVMDIKAGDLIEIDNIKYRASVPYKPLNHHTEVEISVKKDV